MSRLFFAFSPNSAYASPQSSIPFALLPPVRSAGNASNASQHAGLSPWAVSQGFENLAAAVQGRTGGFTPPFDGREKIC